MGDAGWWVAGFLGLWCLWLRSRVNDLDGRLHGLKREIQEWVKESEGRTYRLERFARGHEYRAADEEDEEDDALEDEEDDALEDEEDDALDEEEDDALDEEEDVEAERLAGLNDAEFIDEMERVAAEAKRRKLPLPGTDPSTST